MFKRVYEKVWVFDVEWVPDPLAGSLLYKLPESMPVSEIIQRMWKEGGATEEDPMPYLKTALCRVVSISFVTRYAETEGIKIRLHSLPSDSSDLKHIGEESIIGTFLQALGKRKPQLVGYNSLSSDLKILIQRGVANGIQACEFCARPDKPWEGVDYFSDYSDWNVDLLRILGGRGKSSPSLNEMALVSGIPGKMEVDGEQVANLWLNGELDKIIAYNECDALTTYLLWLKLSYFGGHFTPEEYQEEQERVKELLKNEGATPNRVHLQNFLKEWKHLQEIVPSKKP
jgi:predicted PolB exonuclease-like 3'-5' exonuclease